MGHSCSVDAGIQLLLDKGMSNGKSAKTVEGFEKDSYLTRAEAITFIKNLDGRNLVLKRKPKYDTGCKDDGRETKSDADVEVVPTKPQADPLNMYGYSINSNTTNDSSVILSGTFDRDRALAIAFHKDGKYTHTEFYTTTNKQLNLKLWLKNGPGEYKIAVAYKYADDNGNAYHWGFPNNDGFIISNNDQLDRSFLFPTTLIQSDDPEIIALAQSITRGVTDDVYKTRLIHDWVAKNIAYDVDTYFSATPAKWYSAKEVLRTRVAECNGYTNLTAALNRALGLKTKFVRGTVPTAADGPFKGKWADHAWVEVYAGDRWVTQDPTWDAGYVAGKSFIPGFKTTYYDPDPSEFMKDHKKTGESNY